MSADANMDGDERCVTVFVLNHTWGDSIKETTEKAVVGV